MTGTSRNGFNFEIDDSKLNDWEVVELLVEAEDNNVSSFVKVSKIILGEEQFTQLKKFMRDKFGKIEFSGENGMVEEIYSILKFNDDSKN